MKYLPFLVLLVLSCSSAPLGSSLEGVNDDSLQDGAHILEHNASPALHASINFYESNKQEFNNVQDQHTVFPIFNTDSIALLTKIDNKAIEIKTLKKKLIYKNIDPTADDRYFVEDIVQYYNVGYNKDLAKHLVYASYYEYGEYFLIDNATADIDTLNGFPYFSPNLEKLMCYSINQHLETEIKGQFPDYVSEQEFYVSIGNRFEINKKISFDYIPTEIKWLNDSTLFIKGINSSDYDQVIEELIPNRIDFDGFVFKKVKFH